jgi:hypothetical protein
MGRSLLYIYGITIYLIYKKKVKKEKDLFYFY